MRWTSADAPKHSADCKDNAPLSEVWAAAANRALDGGKDEATALAFANAAVAAVKDFTDFTDAAAIKARVEAVFASFDFRTIKKEVPGGPKGQGDEIIYRRDARLAPSNGTGPISLDETTREIDMVISTGVAVLRRDFWTGDEFNEVLDMSPSAIRMARLQAGAPVLDSHQWFAGMDAMLGSTVPGSARIEDKELRARARFSKNSDLANRVFNDLRDGIRIPLSGGYKVHAFREDRTTSPTTRTITDWEPVEVSCVSVPAEETGTGFRSHPAAGNRGTTQRRDAALTRKETAMDKPRRQHGETDADLKVRIGTWFKDNDPVEGESAEQLAKRVDAYFAELQKAEAAVDAQTRAHADRDKLIAQMLTGTARASDGPAGNMADYLDVGERAGMSITEIRKAMRPGMSIDEFRTFAFEYLAKKSKTTAVTATHETEQPDNRGGNNGGGSRVQIIGSPELDGRAEAMAEALSLRMLASRRVPAVITKEQQEWCQTREIEDHVARAFRVVDGKEKPQHPRTAEYIGRYNLIVELAAECIGHRFRGTLLRPVEAYEIIRRAWHSTGDFPGLFENALNKSLLARYQVAMPTYRQIAIERPFQDFRPHPQLRTGDFPQPQLVTETGEIKFGTFGESKEIVSVLPYGIAIGISRQMMVNDDLGAIDEVLGTTGTGILRFENTTFFNMLLLNSGAGPVLNQDGKNVFTFGAITVPPAAAIGHNNYADTFAHLSNAPSVTTLSAGRAALRGMKSIDGQFLNVNPTILLVGATNQTAAEQLVTSITPALVGSVNPFQGKLQATTEAQIPPNGATGEPWYLFADPQVLPCFVYGFLAGSGGPRVRTDEPFGVQGVRVSLEHDFGVGAIDYRGAYRNIGLTA